MNPVVYRLTIFERDGITPWFGSADVYGEIVEADFQTPDPTLAHDRPYLRPPEGFSPTELDFLNGASRIGAGSVAVMDKRITAGDQTSGLVTSRIDEAPGSRAVLERWIEDTSTWRKIIDGVVGSYSVDPGELLVYWFHLRDAREFEREQPLFYSNHVIFGEDSRSGPGIDYGRLPFWHPPLLPSYATTHTHLLKAVLPFLSQVTGQGAYDHFERMSEADPADGIFYGFAFGPNAPDGLHFNLKDDVAFPTQEADGVFRYREFYLKWRPAGSSDPFIELRGMPVAQYARAVTNSFESLPGLDVSPRSRGVPTLYFGSTVEAEVPTSGQHIEFYIMAERITADSPFWWDGGTLGDLLLEIVAGDHTEEIPQERYDAGALAAFALSSRPARFKLTAPVGDRRRWVEENIYKASFTAPGFNLAKELRPVPWRMPTLAELADAPVLDVATIQPIGEWEHGTDNAVSEVEYTYIHEHLTAPEVAATRTSGRGGGVPSSKYVELLDDTQVDFWRQLVEVPTTVRATDPDATLGAQKLVYAPVTIRSIGGVDGRPFAGDTQSDLGDQIAKEATAAVFPRFSRGAPKYAVEVTATAANLDLYDGQFVLVRFAPLPNYATGKRGLSRWMQIYGISDIDPSKRRVQVVDTGVIDVTDDPEIVSPTLEDCLTGGVLEFVNSGRAVRTFRADGVLTNTCDHPVTVRVLLIAGGGGGENPTSGGGGAGGVLIAENVVVAAGAAIPVRVGAGGPLDTSGEDSVMWADTDGTALDPDVDPAPVALRAIGGGMGGKLSPNIGGSGGGAGGNVPGSGGATNSGAAGTPPQGHAGGAGKSYGGSSTCQGVAGGGGGSYAENGAVGVVEPVAVGGQGGRATLLTEWGVWAGAGGGGGTLQIVAGSGPSLCPPEQDTAGSAGGLYGGGGGGAGGLTDSTPGKPGIIVVMYTGPAPSLAPPPPPTTTVTDLNQVEACIAEADWPAVALDGYRVRIDFAVGDTEPDAASSDWQLAGYLEAPGCILTPAAPVGAKVWTRANAESREFIPSEPSTPGDDATPETPGLLAAALTISDAGLGTATWGPNAFAVGVRVRGLIHDGSATLTRPLPLLADVAASTGLYAVPGTVPEGEYETLDLEAWSGFGADPATPTLTEDSSVSRNSPICNGVWADVRDGAGTETVRLSNQIDVRIKDCNSSNNLTGIWRGILSYSVAAYDNASTALTASLTLRVLSKTETLTGQSVCLVGATPAAPALHVDADYSQLGTTLFSDDVKTLASITVGTYITFALNAAGLAALQSAIAAGGTLSLGLRLAADRANTAPTWGSNLDAVISFASLNHATVAYRPVLAVTTVPVLSGSIGNIYRVTRQRPVRTLVAPSDGLDGFDDVAITGLADEDLLQYDDYSGVWRNRTPAEVRASMGSTFPPSAHTHPYSDLTGSVPTWNQNTSGSAASLSATLAYNRLPAGGGTWANGGALSVTGGVLTVAGLIGNGPANVYGVTANGSATSGQSFGLEIRGGTTSADKALLIRSVAGTDWAHYIRGDGLIVLSRALTGASFSTHAIEDMTSLGSSAGGNSYATFDALPSIVSGNSQAYNHISHFQARGKHLGSGLLSTWYGFMAEPTITGPATDVLHYQVRDALGAGTITKQVGIRVEALTRGSTNYAIETLGTARSVFGGDVTAGGTITSVGAMGVGVGPIAQFQVKMAADKDNVFWVTTSDFTLASVGSLFRMGFGALTGDTYGVFQVLNGGAVTNGELRLNPLGGNVLVGAPIITAGYTVATLPAGTLGMIAHVTDALLPAFGAAIAGGGAVKRPVFFDGTNWIA